MQKERWQRDFQESRERYIESFQKRDHSEGSSSRENKFQVPDSYLPIDKRSVLPGISGCKEKLRRDQYVVRKELRKRRGDDSLGTRKRLAHMRDYSMPDLSHSLVDGQIVRFSNLDESVNAQISRNHTLSSRRSRAENSEA